jgi:perosamine synthetase
MIRLVQPHITSADLTYLNDRLLSGLLEEDENEVERFEQEFAAAVGVKEGLAVNSGTSALHLALHALGVGVGDEVILPSYTCVALLHAIHACGATPVLADNACDVRNADFQIRPEEIRRRLTPRTKAVLVSQMFGTLLPVHPFDFGVPVLEDFTLSLGANLDGRKAGSLGAIGVCSLHHSKMISCGQGGMVVSNDAKLMERARRFATYDAPMEAWRTTAPDLLRGQYEPAASYRMSSLQAALGVSQLRQLEGFIAHRQRIARKYTEAFSAAGLCCPVVPADDRNIFFRYMLRMSQPVVPVIEKLREKGIQAGRGVYPPLHYLRGLPDTDFPGATECIENLLSVPVHPAISEKEAETIVECVLEAVGSKIHSLPKERNRKGEDPCPVSSP